MIRIRFAYQHFKSNSRI